MGAGIFVGKASSQPAFEVLSARDHQRPDHDGLSCEVVNVPPEGLASAPVSSEPGLKVALGATDVKVQNSFKEHEAEAPKRNVLIRSQEEHGDVDTTVVA